MWIPLILGEPCLPLALVELTTTSCDRPPLRVNRKWNCSSRFPWPIRGDVLLIGAHMVLLGHSLIFPSSSGFWLARAMLLLETSGKTSHISHINWYTSEHACLMLPPVFVGPIQCVTGFVKTPAQLKHRGPGRNNSSDRLDHL